MQASKVTIQDRMSREQHPYTLIIISSEEADDTDMVSLQQAVKAILEQEDNTVLKTNLTTTSEKSEERDSALAMYGKNRHMGMKKIKAGKILYEDRNVRFKRPD